MKSIKGFNIKEESFVLYRKHKHHFLWIKQNEQIYDDRGKRMSTISFHQPSQMSSLLKKDLNLHIERQQPPPETMEIPLLQ